MHYGFDPDLFPVFNVESAERLAGLRLDAAELAMRQQKKEELKDRCTPAHTAGIHVPPTPHPPS